jgi:hypothetical protein
MRKIKSFFGVILVLVFVVFINELNAQSPDKMSYQAVVRDASNNLVSSSNVGLRISIIQGTPDGAAVFTEEHNVQTNANGLISLEIGSGTNQQGNILSIDWGNGPFYIMTESDPTGGMNYSIIGTTQLLSVPYALFSNRVPVSVSAIGDTLMIGGQTIIIPGISAANNNGGGSGGGGGSDTTGIYPNGTVHCDFGPTEVVEVINPITGKTWMDRNLAASRVAISVVDTFSYGGYFQWGRRADGHQCRNSSVTSQISSTYNPPHGDFIFSPQMPEIWMEGQNDSLWQGQNGINNPCPIGFRVPTETEFFAERQTWSSSMSPADGAFASPLKFTVGGLRSGSAFFERSSAATYWTSTVSGSDVKYFIFGFAYAAFNDANRMYGMTVRCIKD